MTNTALWNNIFGVTAVLGTLATIVTFTIDIWWRISEKKRKKIEKDEACVRGVIES